MAKPKSRKKRAPKRVLALPDLEHAKTAVLNSLTSASGQRTDDHAIREFVVWYRSEPRLAFNRTVVLATETTSNNAGMARHDEPSARRDSPRVVGSSRRRVTRRARVQFRRNRAICSLMNVASSGLPPPPAECPQSDGIGTNETSLRNWLWYFASPIGKYRSVSHGI